MIAKFPQFKLGILLFTVLALLSSCARGARPGLFRQRYVILNAWTKDQSIIFTRIDYVDGVPSCDSTGFYILLPSGRARPRRIGFTPCSRPVSFSRAAVSPDLSQLVYADFFGSIHSYNLERGTDTVITSGCLPMGNDLSWSPDGRTIALAAGCHLADYVRLHLIDATGANRRPVGAGPETGAESEPSWAPDGRSIVLERGLYPKLDSVAVVDVATGTRRFLTRGHSPQWSPSGQYIAFRRLEGTGSLWRIRPDGTGEQMLLSAPSSDHARLVLLGFVWSPDGRHLALVRGEGLWMINSDGTGLRPIMTF